MTPEEHEKFAAFAKGMMKDLAPVGTHETFLANSLGEEAWRLNQIRARCTNLSALGDFAGAGKKHRPTEGQDPRIETAVTDTAVARDLSKEFALMSLYGQRTQRAFEKYKKDLNELQGKRKADQAAELDEARLLFQLADSQGLVYDPKEDGFVFSLHQIKTHAERHHRLILAKRTETDYRKRNNLNNHPNSGQSGVRTTRYRAATGRCGTQTFSPRARTGWRANSCAVSTEYGAKSRPTPNRLSTDRLKHP